MTKKNDIQAVEQLLRQDYMNYWRSIFNGQKKIKNRKRFLGLSEFIMTGKTQLERRK